MTGIAYSLRLGPWLALDPVYDNRRQEVRRNRSSPCQESVLIPLKRTLRFRCVPDLLVLLCETKDGQTADTDAYKSSSSCSQICSS